MAESSLSVAKTELDQAIARYLGYGRDNANWGTGTDHLADIDFVRNEGTSRFYGEKDWFFLSPTATLTTTIGDYDQALPDDFGSMRGSFFFAANKGYQPPRHVNVDFVRRAIAQSNANGVMTYFAINPISMTGASGQRWEVLWYAPPDAAYVLTYRYNVQRDALSASYPYPAGGAMFRNAILYACLAAAEHFIQRQDGHEGQYQLYKAQALEWDARNGGTYLGLNKDSRDGRIVFEPTHYATYNGVVPAP